MTLESISRKAERLGATSVSASFVKERRKSLRIIAAAPQEPTLTTDTVIYQDSETGKYYKLVRPRK